MSTNEQKLLKILSHYDSESTVLIAIKVISAFLEQLQEVPTLQVDGLQELS